MYRKQMFTCTISIAEILYPVSSETARLGFMYLTWRLVFDSAKGRALRSRVWRQTVLERFCRRKFAISRKSKNVISFKLISCPLSTDIEYFVREKDKTLCVLL